MKNLLDDLPVLTQLNNVREALDTLGRQMNRYATSRTTRNYVEQELNEALTQFVYYVSKEQAGSGTDS